jgi:hypothetical protein
MSIKRVSLLGQPEASFEGRERSPSKDKIRQVLQPFW